MTNITSKDKDTVTPTAKKTGIRPLDMSWNYMDDMFNNIGHHWPFPLFDDHPTKSKDLNLNPNVDIKEDKSTYALSAELPGLEVEDISVDVSDKVLTISGEKKTEHKEDKDSSYHVMERRYGYFKRCFTLPESVEQENIKADFKKGILHITLPKSKQARDTQRKIKIGN
jgi:HSP20 family protein